MSRSDASCLASMRILVVEDEFIISMMYEELLGRLGSTVLGPARTVEEALGMIESHAPQAVLLDANLNGRLSSPVAEASDARGVPYLLVTGYEAATLADPVLRRAPRLAKPFTNRTLIEAMVRCFC